jgi:hypothetical protein
VQPNRNARQWRAFSQEQNKELVRPDWLAGDAVHREPVSTLDSLITGKNTGKFIKVGLLQYPDCPDEPRIRALCTRFPANRNREFSERKQRMQFSKQGIYPMIVTTDHMPVVRHATLLDRAPAWRQTEAPVPCSAHVRFRRQGGHQSVAVKMSASDPQRTSPCYTCFAAGMGGARLR